MMEGRPELPLGYMHGLAEDYKLLSQAARPTRSERFTTKSPSLSLTPHDRHQRNSCPYLHRHCQRSYPTQFWSNAFRPSIPL